MLAPASSRSAIRKKHCHQSYLCVRFSFSQGSKPAVRPLSLSCVGHPKCFFCLRRKTRCWTWSSCLHEKSAQEHINESSTFVPPVSLDKNPFDLDFGHYVFPEVVPADNEQGSCLTSNCMQGVSDGWYYDCCFHLSQRHGHKTESQVVESTTGKKEIKKSQGVFAHCPLLSSKTSPAISTQLSAPQAFLLILVTEVQSPHYRKIWRHPMHSFSGCTALTSTWRVDDTVTHSHLPRLAAECPFINLAMISPRYSRKILLQPHFTACTTLQSTLFTLHELVSHEAHELLNLRFRQRFRQ